MIVGGRREAGVLAGPPHNGRSVEFNLLLEMGLHDPRSFLNILNSEDCRAVAKEPNTFDHDNGECIDQCKGQMGW